MDEMFQAMHVDHGLLMVEAWGEFSIKGAKRAFLEVLATLARCKAEKVLYDCRRMKGNPQTLERFFYGEFAAGETLKLVKKHGIVPRFAYVLHEPLRDPDKLGETTAVNRGMRVKVFETREHAFAWLDSTGIDKRNAGDA